MHMRACSTFTSRCAATMLLGGLFKPEAGPALLGDSAPTWEQLKTLSHQTATGQALLQAEADRAAGAGPTHTDATLRLFGKSEEDVRLTLYRDTAAWCPYCQKVWLLLEEKQVPYRIEKINMRSYGDKPREFLAKVPGGILPAIELDGQLMTESLVIMQTIDEVFSSYGPQMVPPAGTPERERASELLRLERELFARWCELTFRPGKGMLDSAEKGLLQTLRAVDAALGASDGPWFLGGAEPSLVDLQYVSHVERLLASVLYWKGLRLRGRDDLAHVDAWLCAFEARPSYLATKSDYYTHVMDIPPQYGPGFGIGDAEPFAKAIRAGAGESWQLPLSLGADGHGAIEPLAPLQDGGEEAARHEAAYELVANSAKVAAFAARGAGQPGGWAGPGKAELADPYAEPNRALLPEVDVCLRHVANALLVGADAAVPLAAADVGGDGGARRPALASCLEYLRDRVGVPRDMGQAAAMHFRAHINWLIAKL